jgi:TolA-binding protein
MKGISIIIVLFLYLTSYSQDTKQFDKGVELFNSEDYDKALKALKKYQKKNDGLTVRFYIAGCYLKKEEFGIAKERYIEIVNTYNDDKELGWSMVNIGSCYRELNQIDSAICPVLNNRYRF